ncbi:MAG: ferrous iron transport protein B [Candidatus Azobacteroides sp.]|nr:ferrous iron transport protein B [Candidatus Azobacteroides sp.]
MEDQQNTIRYLSDLPIGETAVITKVKGYGAFRKRINEMGFIAGTQVKAIKKAPFPFRDPIEYELMGYRVSLRISEARMIEIVDEDDIVETHAYKGTFLSDEISRIAKEKGKTIQVALVGNPNSGKTTLFNFATGKQERVGNYGGVTVDVKTAHFTQNGYRIDLSDLPGTYSLSEYSPEELFVRKHLTETMPDVVINVVDASNLERNLFLTTQLIDMNIKVVIALNMYDELSKKGDQFDYEYLGKMIGIPIIPTIASKGKGINELIDKVIELYEDKDEFYRHIHINYGEDINREIDRIKVKLKADPALTDQYHSRYLALQWLENDKHFAERITDAKYAFIRGALKETYHSSPQKNKMKGYGLDNVLINKWLGIPLFLIFMWLMFQLTFSLGSYPVEWIESGVNALNVGIKHVMPEGILRDLLTDGIIGGVGSVIVFFPNILILFFCISLMEDTGYMARAAFIMDKMMHKIGLHGKSFIPMLMGFGCNVPAIMATRTLESRKDRLLTQLIIPFMSCSARLPLYVLFIPVFFVRKQGVVLFSIYITGILIAILTALLFNKILFKKQDIPFVMELPPYRWPTLRNISTYTWGKSVQYLQKMGTIILVASILIWALGYFPRETQAGDEASQLEHSYIGRLGHAVEPVIKPLGYDWKVGVSILTGMAAKEVVVSSMGVLYQTGSGDKELSATLRSKLQEAHTFTPLTAYSFMIFILIYFPCVAALAAIYRESGLKWALFSAFYTTACAWLVAFGIYRIGGLFL